MTTAESLFYSGRLYGLTMEEATSKADEVMASLGLESCKDVKVGSVLIKGLSGGQKRRPMPSPNLNPKPNWNGAG